MKLFSFEGFKIKISEEALNIKAFRDLIKRDKSIDKSKALLELGYIYFFCDPRSDYAFIVDKEEKAAMIKTHEGLDIKWKPDSKVIDAMEVYTILTQTSYSLLLEDTRVAIDNIRRFLRDLDLKEVDEKNKPKYTVSSVVAAIKDIPKLIKEISEAERIITKELEEAGRMKANRNKKITEDGFDQFFIKNG